MLISLVSAKGSPGVTAAALALASRWPRTAIVADVDPQGGDILTGLTGGRQHASRGIVDVLVDARHGDVVEALHRHVVRPVAHGPLVLGGFGSPEQAAAVSWAPLARILSDLPDADVVADCGRLAVGHPVVELLRRSHTTALVTRSSLRAVRASSRAVPALRDALGVVGDDDDGHRLGLLVVGPDMPYAVDEIEQACGTEVVDALPDNLRAARVWTDAATPPRWFHRTALQQAAAVVADELLARAAESSRVDRTTSVIPR